MSSDYGQSDHAKSGAWDASDRHTQHETHIHKTAMVVGPGRTDFGHSNEKRSRSDRDDGRDMYQQHQNRNEQSAAADSRQPHHKTND
jgi:hypothetical protein